jgi:hypothetical protein
MLGFLHAHHLEYIGGYRLKGLQLIGLVDVITFGPPGLS